MTRNLMKLILMSGVAAWIATPAAANDWGGFSLGIGGGYGMAKNDLDLGAPIDTDASASVGIHGLGGAGGFFTLGAGYDHVLLGPLVVGAFVDYDFSDIDTNINVNAFGFLDANVGFKIKNQLSVGGRIGYLISPTTMYYSTFGYAHAESSDLDASLSLGGATGGGTLASIGSFDGYFLGGGIETMISNGFSVKAEYRYTSLQAESLTFTEASGIGDAVTGSIKPQIQTGRVSLNYRFGDGKTEKVDDSIPPITSSWTGGYIGVGTGYSVANSDLKIGENSPVPGSAFGVTVPFGGDGGFISGTVGYDYQMNSRFVIGAFADADLTNVDQKNSFGINTDGLGIGFGTSTGFRNILMVGGRLGYLTTPDTLVFVSGGYANASMEDTYLTSGASFEGVPLGSESITLIDGRRYDGGFIGGGIETRLTDALSLKAEYRYIDLGTRSATLLPNEQPEINQVISTKFDSDIQTGRVSINYRFGNPLGTADAAPLK
ncbi:hypothetical protein DLM45_12395 [Hyphomicrobium methylovorum]|uniref:outer membrane protein n=1 Tax=Hyphomicrobium methylovorum TaxID=84 RepID=UPI0015E717DE|nr:outer membrane beta-barrel protein [Hyphomicrobium methylovorum]MBA2127014.1 hypothetical protein [Hyphomicrobium methylovorum]